MTDWAFYCRLGNLKRLWQKFLQFNMCKVSIGKCPGNFKRNIYFQLGPVPKNVCLRYLGPFTYAQIYIQNVVQNYEFTTYMPRKTCYGLDPTSIYHCSLYQIDLQFFLYSRRPTSPTATAPTSSTRRTAPGTTRTRTTGPTFSRRLQRRPSAPTSRRTIRCHSTASCTRTGKTGRPQPFLTAAIRSTKPRWVSSSRTLRTPSLNMRSSFEGKRTVKKLVIYKHCSRLY